MGVLWHDCKSAGKCRVLGDVIALAVWIWMGHTVFPRVQRLGLGPKCGWVHVSTMDNSSTVAREPHLRL